MWGCSGSSPRATTVLGFKGWGADLPEVTEMRRKASGRPGDLPRAEHHSMQIVH